MTAVSYNDMINMACTILNVFYFLQIIITCNDVTNLKVYFLNCCAVYSLRLL